MFHFVVTETVKEKSGKRKERDRKKSESEVELERESVNDPLCQNRNYKDSVLKVRRTARGEG